MTAPRIDDAEIDERASRRLVHGAKAIGAVIFGFALCALLFRGTDWSGVGHAIASADLRWIAGTILVGGASHLARARRLACIVRAAHPVRFRDLFAVNQVGLLINYAMLARLGEAVRAVLLSWLGHLPISHAVAVIVIDRVFDVVVLLVMILVVWLAFPADGFVTIAEGTFTNRQAVVVSGEAIVSSAAALVVVLVAALAALGFLYARRTALLRVAKRILDPKGGRLSERVKTVLRRLSDAVQVLKSRPALAKSMFWSLAAWSANVIGMEFLLLAFSIEPSILAPILIQALVVLATSVPIAPGLVGQYHMAVVVGLFLVVPGVGVSEAKAISLVGHLVVLLQVGILGLYCLTDRGLLAKVIESLRRTRGVQE